MCGFQTNKTILRSKWWQNAWIGMERVKMCLLSWACGTGRKSLLQPVWQEVCWGHAITWARLSLGSGGWCQPATRWIMCPSAPSREETQGSSCHALVRVGIEVSTLNYYPLFLFSPSNTQKILFWKAVIVSSADLEMPAVLQHLENEGQREEAELSCWVKEKGGRPRVTDKDEALVGN